LHRYTGKVAYFTLQLLHRQISLIKYNSTISNWDRSLLKVYSELVYLLLHFVFLRGGRGERKPECRNENDRHQLWSLKGCSKWIYYTLKQYIWSLYSFCVAIFRCYKTKISDCIFSISLEKIGLRKIMWFHYLVGYSCSLLVVKIHAHVG
jgi:hypothetical protein